MQRIALHARLAPGEEDEYERVHAVIPDDLDAALREAGVHAPANIPWQQRMSQLLEVEDDYSGSDMGLGLVWELP